ncbi:MAG: 2,3-bisphosphoglycerate-dependent phosphoglycerate mutase [Arenibacter sp.]
MGKLILIRHGQSLWNLENIFTGWTDIDLSPQGKEEAKNAGAIIERNNINIDICFASYLKRAVRTAWIVLDSCEQMHVNTYYSWKLNERHYGDWQGKNKDETLKEVGEKKYWAIRRGYYESPPKLAHNNKQHPKFDPNYKNVDPAQLPSGESLEDSSKRVINYYYEAIVPQLAKGKTVMVSAHGNSLRALIGYLNKMSPNEIANLEVLTGVPHIYEFDDNLNLNGHHKLE